MRMRFRTDSWHIANLKTCHNYDEYYKDIPEDLADAERRKEWEDTPKAEPGDVWRIHWSHHDPPDGPQIDDRVAGYAICCIGCGHVHAWTTASNCGQKFQSSYKDSKTGEDVPFMTCPHSGVSSCWEWSGSAEEGTLTASPSLLVTLDKHEAGGCNWHGYIQNGDIHV